MKRFGGCVVAFLYFALMQFTQAENVDLHKSAVYIECEYVDAGRKKKVTGTGVLVKTEDGSNGHVLTARHIVRPKGMDEKEIKNVDCRGNISIRKQGDLTQLEEVKVRADDSVDAALLRFHEDDTILQNSGALHLDYCKVSGKKDLLRQKIIVSGFPFGAASRSMSSREGIISDVQPRNNKIEIDGMIASGMSGGLVTFANSKKLIGIVAGTTFNILGDPVSHLITPIDKLVSELSPRIVEAERECTDSYGVTEKVSWSIREDKKRLGMEVKDGYCFVTEIRGRFNSTKDRIFITEENGEYYLDGFAEDLDSKVGGGARCIWF